MPTRQEAASGLELSVVIPTLGMYPVLRRVLDGYARQDASPGSFEVVVVVDAADPEPETAHALIGNRPYAVRRLTGGTPGASANRNAGWHAATAPIVLFTDNDTIPIPRLVSEHLAWHRRHPAEEVGVLGHVRWAPEMRVTPFMRWLEHGIQFDYPSIDGIEAGWGRFYTANVSLKRKVIRRVGDFDQERLPYLYEDLEWSYRASKLGFRLLYNRRAVVDHLRPVTLELWKERVRRVAVAERQFVSIHPEIPPYFHRLFSGAAEAPPARGRGLRLAPVVPRRVPWLGPRVWSSADLTFRQALAPHFLAAWEAAGDRPRDAGQPDVSEREAESSLGSEPGGPK